MRTFSDQELVRREKAENIRNMGIDPFGKKYERTDYAFNIKEGVVNYAGDIRLDIITGRVLVWHKVKDYYDLSVSDNFEEILEQKESSYFLSIFSDYEFINQSKNIKTMQPLNCHVIRDN